MSSIRIIKRRVKSAKNISQITRAMQMVAASKMRKAQEAALLGRPYQEKIFKAVSELVRKIDLIKHPLLRGEKEEENAEKKSLVVLISTNKGLCGGLNSNLFRCFENWFSDKHLLDFITLGKKGESFVIGSGRRLLADFSSSFFLENVPAVVSLLSQGFIKGEYQGVYLVFNSFKSFLKQEPVKRRILPLGIRQFKEEKLETEEFYPWQEYLIEPKPLAVFNSLLPHYLEIQVRNAVLEAEASEHSARMLAMKNATDNARSLISDLTLEYNQLRQEAITYEIADMVTARLAVQ